MAKDSDPIKVYKETPHGITGIVAHVVRTTQYKKWMLFFIIFIVVSSNVFIDRVLTNFSGAVDLHTPNTYGTVIQGIFLVCAYILVEWAIDKKIL